MISITSLGRIIKLVYAYGYPSRRVGIELELSMGDFDIGQGGICPYIRFQPFERITSDELVSTMYLAVFKNVPERRTCVMRLNLPAYVVWSQHSTNWINLMDRYLCFWSCKKGKGFFLIKIPSRMLLAIAELTSFAKVEKKVHLHRI